MARRSSYGTTWWGKRWIAALEEFGWANRLQRGRSYARTGHVKELEIQPGKVLARVAGSRPQPYRVSIALTPLSDAEWRKVIAALTERVSFAASLLAGEMPKDIEEAFSGVQVPLFPKTAGDLRTSCTCPDWANPCKHVAAAYYCLGEEFDRDPFLLLHLRGRDRESLLAALREQRAAGAEPAAGTSAGPAAGPSAGPFAVLAGDTAAGANLDQFWRPGPKALTLSFRMEPPARGATTLRRLGPLQSIDGAGPAMQRLERYYTVIGREALGLALGWTAEDEEDDRDEPD